jgi:hypothetical protein
MDQFLLFLCCKSCLKGNDNIEYYEILNIHRKCSKEAIKSAYRRQSLQLHPDKLAQKGIQPTNEQKQQFLKIKEAYDVLSDPKRRTLYDELGGSGMKLLDSPHEINPLDLVKNFQKNRSDRASLMLLIFLLFVLLFIFPILIALKCDNRISGSWIAVWIPAWTVDLIFIISAISLFTVPSKGTRRSRGSMTENMMDDDDEDSDTIEVPFIVKISTFIRTVLFVLIQVFILIRLDEDIKWSWFIVFTPWILYEFLISSPLVPLAFFSRIPLNPDEESNVLLSKDYSNTNEDQYNQNLKAENEYFDKIVEKMRARKTILISGCRCWFSLFLALQLDNDVAWDWGLVFLPVWIAFIVEFQFIQSLRSWSKAKSVGLDIDGIVAGEDTDPAHVNQYRQSKELLASSNFSIIMLSVVVYMVVLEVIRISIKHFSFFIVELPIFILLSCCSCVVLCTFFCLANMDVNELNENEILREDLETPLGTEEYGTFEEKHIEIQKQNI